MLCIIQSFRWFSAILKKGRRVGGRAAGQGYFADGLHGDLKQVQRDRVMSKFRSGAVDILVATDVAARGIDVDDIEAVFNYDLPQDEEYYVHRIGRTARAGREEGLLPLLWAERY